MKKMLETCRKFLLCGAVTVSLCGCSAKLPFTAPRTVDLDTRYSVNADIACGELKAAAEIRREGDGKWEFRFTEPKQLSGLTLSLDETGLTAGLGALSFSAEPNEVYTMIPDVISKAIDALPEIQEGSLSEEDGVLTLSAEFDGKPVTITAAKSTGELISLKCPYYKLAVYFSGQTELPESAETIESEELLVLDE